VFTSRISENGLFAEERESGSSTDQKRKKRTQLNQENVITILACPISTMNHPPSTSIHGKNAGGKGRAPLVADNMLAGRRCAFPNDLIRLQIDDRKACFVVVEKNRRSKE
jgi:hypothetical protein